MPKPYRPRSEPRAGAHPFPFVLATLLLALPVLLAAAGCDRFPKDPENSLEKAS